MRENRMQGSVRGVLGNRDSYRDPFSNGLVAAGARIGRADRPFRSTPVRARHASPV